MKIYRIFPYEEKKFVYLKSIGLKRKEGFSLRKGNKLDTDELNLQIELGNVQKELPDILGSGSSVYLINDRTKSIFFEYLSDTDINMIPVKVLSNDYWLLNILGLRDLVDREKSTIEYYENGAVDSITNLEYNSIGIQEFDIFRMKDVSYHVFITENLKLRFEKEKITGITYFSGKNMNELS